ncbi:MAG: YitT family protein [Eubacteriales bacterium]
MKITGKSLFRSLQTCICVLIGNALLAFLVVAFIMPHNILIGGTTGIGIALNQIFHIDTALLILILNSALLIFGGIVLGRKFFISTIAGSLLYPVFIAIIQRIPGITTLTDNSLLAALFAGCLLGISLGLLMRIGSSTGGMDVVNLVLHKWFHIPLSILVYLTDFIIIGGQALFCKPEQTLLGILTLVLETLVLEKVMIAGKSQIQVFAISEKYDELRDVILHELQAGVTMTLIETGYSGQMQKGVLCVIPPRKLYNVTESIKSIDPNAFITITQIKEVRGRGFTLERKYGL